MNRSILIVTCDFLVLAAMSLSIGTTGVGEHTGTSTTKLSSPAARLVEMIDEEMARHEEVKSQKEELEKKLDDFRAIALQDIEEIASKDEKLAQIQAQLDEALAALSSSQNELLQEKTKAETNLAKREQELDLAKKAIAGQEEDLKRSATALLEKDKALTLSAIEIQERDRIIREKEADLQKSALELKLTSQELTDTITSLKEKQTQLEEAKRANEATSADLEKNQELLEKTTRQWVEAFASLQLSEQQLKQVTKEKEESDTALQENTRKLEEAKRENEANIATIQKNQEQLEKIKREQEATVAELQQNQKQLEEAKRANEAAVAELQQNQEQLEEAKRANEAAVAELQQKQTRLEEAKRENEANLATIQQNQEQFEQANKEKAREIAILQQKQREMEAANKEKDKQIAELEQQQREMEAASKENATALAGSLPSDVIAELQETRQQVEQLKKEKVAADEKSMENQRQLMAAKREVAEAEQKLAQAKREIDQRDKTIREKQTRIEENEIELALLNQERTTTFNRLMQSQMNLSQSSGQIESLKFERELFREQARIERNRAEEASARAHNSELRYIETASVLRYKQNQLDNLQSALFNMSTNNARLMEKNDENHDTLLTTQEQLVASKATVAQKDMMIAEKNKQIEEKQQDLAVAREEASELKKMLNNDVLNSYNASALELAFHLVNERSFTFSDTRVDKSFFLPAVSLGGKNWVVSAFRDVTGLNLNSGYTKVPELKYQARRPQTDTWISITGPALCLYNDCRVCLFPIPDNNITPMRALSFDELRERGVDKLTLFKSDTYSKASADITGRCSLSLEPNDNHLYIRNSNRSASELKAEVGDFVLSKEGFFIGVVVKVVSDGQASNAICYVFPSVDPDLSQAYPLRLTRDSSQYYLDFVNDHEAIRKYIEQFEKGK